MDVRHREHCSANKHTEQSADSRLEPRDVDQQPVLGIQAQCHHQDGPNDEGQRVSSEMSCKTKERETVTCMRIHSHMNERGEVIQALEQDQKVKKSISTLC